jgi:excisionase family DNA binding protein
VEASPKRTPTKAAKETPPASPTTSAIMGLVEAAAYLSVDESDILELLESKEIAGRRIGSNWKITKDAIDKYLNA